MDKPISIISAELQQNLIKTINSSGLPIFITELIVKNLYNDVHESYIKQLGKDTVEYQKSINKGDEE